MKRLSIVLGLLMLSGIAIADVAEKTVKPLRRSGQGRAVHGFEDLDHTTAGAIVVHEWWGLNDYARNRARLLAEEGYVAPWRWTCTATARWPATPRTPRRSWSKRCRSRKN